MDRKKFLIIGIATLCVIFIVITGIVFFQSGEKLKEVSISKPAKNEITQPKIQEPEELTLPSYTYDAVKLKDPFIPLIMKKEDLKNSSLDIEQFKLTGIATDKKGRYALLQTPDGRFYIVRENDSIGLHGGRVTKILNDAIEIKDSSKKTKYLKLRSEEEK